MTDQTSTNGAAGSDEAVVGLVTDGAYTLIVAKFPNTLTQSPPTRR